jgi:putative ABC transport system permease protein
MVTAGILALLAITTAQRRREIGIRLTLGATSRRVVTQLAGEQFAPVMIGIAAGAMTSAMTVRLLESQLYGVGAYDITVWTIVAASLAGAALAGALLPALRATRINPAVVLRNG